MKTKVGMYRCKVGNGTQWKVRWFGEYDPNAGKSKRRSKTFVLKKDAARFQKQKQNEFDSGAPRDPSAETLKGYAEQWLKDKTQNEKLRPATVLLYELTLKRLYGHFGTGRLLRQIDRRAAKTFLAELKPMLDRDEPLSSWSEHRVLRHCKTLFKEAAKDGVTGSSPFDGMKGPKCVPSDWYYLKPDGYRRILDVTATLREKALYCLAYTAGLRETEAIALYWSDIDFEKGQVRIANRPKSERFPPFDVKDTDERVIPLCRDALNLLLELHEAAAEKVPFVMLTEQRCQTIRDKWEECRRQRRPWLNRYWSNNLTRNFHRRVMQAGIDTNDKNLTVHTLRKCCGQNWANVLPMNVVKAFMGHSSIETTEKFYSTVDQEHLDKATRMTDDLLAVKLEPGASDLKVTFSGNMEPIKDVTGPK